MSEAAFLLLLACAQDAASLLHMDAPAIAIDDALPWKGAYVYSTVILRPDADCGVVFHELVHHRQFRDTGGPPLTDYEWRLREFNARRLEIMYRESH